MSSTNTTIEWTDRTWNPVRGCSRVSPGCDKCFAMNFAHRFAGLGKPFDGLTTIRRGKVDWVGHARFVPDALSDPMRWREPQKIFVNSMSDLFHHSVTNEEITKVFAAMAACPQHTFQILTKRPRRARDWFEQVDLFRIGEQMRYLDIPANGRSYPRTVDKWPLKSVWLGVSAENQATADERIPILRSIRALVDYRAMLLFASLEPLLEGIDLATHLKPTLVTNDGRRLQHPAHSAEIPNCGGGTWEWGLDWVIVGGESGPGARTFDIQWARDMVRQCRDAGVPCFVKQLGSRPVAPVTDAEATNYGKRLPLRLKDRKGGDISEWWESLRVREFPGANR